MESTQERAPNVSKHDTIRHKSTEEDLGQWFSSCLSAQTGQMSQCLHIPTTLFSPPSPLFAFCTAVLMCHRRAARLENSCYPAPSNQEQRVQARTTERMRIQKPAWVCEPKNAAALPKQSLIIRLCRPSQGTWILLFGKAQAMPRTHTCMPVNTSCATCMLTQLLTHTGVSTCAHSHTPGGAHRTVSDAALWTDVNVCRLHQ